MVSKKNLFWNLDRILQVTQGKALSKHHQIFDGLGTDTRQPLKNQLFLALKGDAFDAHRFIASAMQNGATGLLVHDASVVTPEILNQVTVIQVSDTLLALQQLAQAYRRQHSGFFVGIAGSNGKTTSKEFTAKLISQFRKVHSAKGSLNNHWGVPFTLLATPEDAEVVVVEMGMNHEGELARLAEIAEVQATVVTTIGVEHIEHFGSLEKIAKAESEIYEYSPASSRPIFNLDNSYIREMMKKYGAVHSNTTASASPLTFSSQDSKADVHLKVKSATAEELVITGHIQNHLGECAVPVFGRHNVTNLMVASSLALAAGLTPEQIWSALPSCRANWGRNQWVSLQSGAKLLFDGYNSNPDSMLALLSNLDLYPQQGNGRRIGVFGQMRELGALAKKYHQEIGEQVGRSGFDEIIFVGEDRAAFAQGIKQSGFSKTYSDAETLNKEHFQSWAQSLRAQDVLFVKGSRGVGLEKFVLACAPQDFNLY